MNIKTKRCWRCKKILPLSSFYKDRSKKYGFSNECKKCCNLRNAKRKKTKEWKDWYERYIERKIVDRRDNMKELKRHGCALCGYNKNWSVLEFHHVNPQNKNFEIGKRRAVTKVFIEEIQKCILLCKNCHAELHHKECNYENN